MITDHRHSGGCSGAALRPIERMTAATFHHALKRGKNRPTVGIRLRVRLWSASTTAQREHEHHRCENLGHRYSQTPSKHSIARPLTERQQGVLVAQESPRYPHSCGFGGGGGPLPPHPKMISARAANTTADMLLVVGRSPRPCAAYTSQRSRHAANKTGRRRASGSGCRCA